MMTHAVIVGGSVAGLMAARVAADHFGRVTVLEPDDLGAPATARRGVPQAAQLHALLHMGRLQAERWFPGLSADLIADGAVVGADDELCQYDGAIRKVSVPGFELIGATRPLIESHIRRHTLRRTNITTLRGRAVGVVFDDVGRPGRVSGIRYQPAGEGPVARGTRLLRADLVVDASGRSTRMGRWLENQGWSAPPTRRMRIDLGYATALFRRGPELPGTKVVVAMPSSASGADLGQDSGAMSEVEGGRWMVVIANYADKRPTADPREFVERCKALQAQPFGEVAARCRMLGDVATYRMVESRRREYAAMERLPGGLVAVGDALAGFNPVYGQGMTSAALHAFCLDRYLRGGASPHGPARGYFRDAAVFVDAAWEVSTTNDLGQPHIHGPYPRGYALTKRLGRLVSQASITDAGVNRRFVEVTNMVTHPRAMRSPGFLMDVLRAVAAERRSR